MQVLTVLCGGGWMSNNLSEGWRRLGCKVEEFFYGSHMGKAWDRRGLRENKQVNTRLLATARRLKAEGRLDLIFAVIYDDVLEENTAKELRKLEVPMVNFHVDLVGQWYRILRTGKYFDRVACAQEDHWSGLIRANIRPYLMPMAANPETSQSAVSTDLPEFEGLLYLGSPWLYRREVLVHLAQLGLPLRIYGHNWLEKGVGSAKPQPQPWRKTSHDIRHYLLPRVREEGRPDLETTVRNRWNIHPPFKSTLASSLNGCVRGAYETTEFTSLVRGAAINLGFTHFSGAPGTKFERRQVRLREFEIPLAGGFYMTQDCLQLRQLFNPGCTVETWNNLRELKEKTQYYLAHPAERLRIARQGQEHCIKNHTWAIRFAELLRELKLSLPMNPGGSMITDFNPLTR